MPWLPIVFVIIIVLMMIILGYFLIRSFLRGYTYLPSKTQSKSAPFSGICVTLLAVSILGVPGYSIMGQILDSE
jgi:hypothetical protein